MRSRKVVAKAGRTALRERKTKKAVARREKAVQRANWTTGGDARRLLALDVSSKAVGWAFFDTGTLKSYGKYLQRGEGHGERLANYVEWLCDLFKQLQPTAIAVEAPFQGRHKYAFAVLTLYRAALLIAHMYYARTELPDKNQLPAHLIKKVLQLPKGTHDENKANAVNLINQLYGTAFQYDRKDALKAKSDDDIADAIAVGHVWLALHEGLEPTEDQ